MAKNIFYHYTAKRFIEGIKREGLTKGVTPIIDNGKLLFLQNNQWITKNRNPEQQLWAIPQKISYSRREVRLKINIPKPYLKYIITMEDFVNRFKDFLPDSFNDFPEESKDWFIYHGQIPYSWIEEYRIIGVIK